MNIIEITKDSLFKQIDIQYLLHKKNDAIIHLSFFLIILTGFMIIITVSLFPGLSETLLLKHYPGIYSVFVTLNLCLYMTLTEKYRTSPLFTSSWLSLFLAFLFEFCTWSLAALYDLPAAAAFTAFPVLLSAFHGHHYQSSLKYPCPFFVSFLAALAGLFLNYDKIHLAIFSISVPAALSMNLFWGTLARCRHEKKKQQEVFREVIDTQIANVHFKTIDRIINILNVLREHNHDTVNEYTGLILLLPGFMKIAQAENPDKDDIRKAVAIAKGIQQCLQSLQHIMKNKHNIELRNQLQSIVVYPCEILENLISEFEQNYPSIHFVGDFQDPLKNYTIPFFGGSTALTQVFHNIFSYTCRDIRKRNPNCIIVESDPDSRNFFVISISDNGSVFTPIQLKTPFCNLLANVHENSNLYASLRILKFNGGDLIIKNRHDNNGRCFIIKLRVIHESETCSH